MSKIISVTEEEAKKYIKSKKHKISVKKISEIKDEDINYSDIPEITEELWENAQIIYPSSKEKISLRLDKDILDWFKAKGKGYQTMINAVLKSYITHHK